VYIFASVLRVLQSIVACCSVLKPVAVCCRNYQVCISDGVRLCESMYICVRLRVRPCRNWNVAVYCSLLQSVAVYCSLLPSVAVCCRLLQSGSVCCRDCCVYIFDYVRWCASVCCVFLCVHAGIGMESPGDLPPIAGCRRQGATHDT